ncbi:hypothetical protein A2U01_0109669, partial [Trifolium medium]|nr:hypothetical protein [Trifolium medium]
QNEGDDEVQDLEYHFHEVQGDNNEDEDKIENDDDKVDEPKSNR